MHKKFVLLATAAVAAALFAMPATASAQNVAACQFSGVAGNITPGVMLVDGEGDYQFSTPEGSTGTRCSQGGAPQTASIFSDGSFDNIVCGTGEAWSEQGGARDDGTHLTTVDGNADGDLNDPEDINKAEYNIQFAGAQGTIFIQEVEDQPDQLPVNGHVTIIPAEGESCTGDGVNAFDVVGEFAAVW